MYFSVFLYDTISTDPGYIAANAVVATLTTLFIGSLSDCVYTQLTDVESAINGLITYDRKVVKLPSEDVKKLNDRLTGTQKK